MCGIAGIIDPSAAGKVEKQLEVVLPLLEQRGPDEEGRWSTPGIGLGMRRLSIIDIEGGSQPFLAAEGNIVVFQNGEIYNFLQLKRQLEKAGYSFRTSSDTEVLSLGYHCWGLSGLCQRLDGMYAVAILDRREGGSLHLIRDRFGEKPLYYVQQGERFAYASNLRALAALPWAGCDINPDALTRYLALSFIPGDDSILENIHRVAPGHSLSYSLKNHSLRSTRYFDLAVSRPGDSLSLSDTVEQLSELMERTVRSRMIADVPVGVFLSGGIDSSLLAAVAAEQKGTIDTFSISFPNTHLDESVYAREVAEKIGSNHHVFEFDSGSFLSLLPQVAEALDEPMGDQASLPTLWLCREARKHVKVVLSGEGGDEVFGGYFYYKPHLEGWQTATRDTLFCPETHATPSGFPLLMPWNDAKDYVAADIIDVLPAEQRILQTIFNHATPLQRARVTDLLTWMPDDLLVKFDRMSMAHSLEGRAPFLDPALVQFGLTLPTRHCIDDGQDKVVLRKLVSRYFDSSIFNRPKQGFVLPMQQWLSDWFAAYGRTSDYFSERNVPFLKTDRISDWFEREVDTGFSNHRTALAIVVLFEWWHRFERDIKNIRQAVAGA